MTSDRTPPDRARPQGKFMWRMLAVVLGGQALVIFFGALTGRGLNPDQEPVVAGLTPFALMSALAVLAVVAAGLMKRPFGPALGWVVQVLSILSGLWVTMMFLVGILFAVLYGYCQRVGRRVDREQIARALEQQQER
ncbi:DUF4233 domain-containing protein [Janibacter cremeus]|uniref:DUF4233 domain-containing protein n=1 Tax=Janibacter cremeus TaxID=1285192 RepID=UPI0023F74699|nr:DUF4233 domain-containing protein [Janibacter cremeus]WEV79493.1 DUF4233 domain-containing protein [Janibacter cremeus]